MGGLAADSAHLRPPFGGVAALCHGLWRQGGRRIRLDRPELVPIIGWSAAGPRGGPCGRLGRGCLCWLWRRVVPGGRGPDQDERGIVVQAGAGMAEQIVSHAVEQIGAQAVSAGLGQLPEPGGQGIAPVARVAGFG
jgi:hypothetical protein